MLARRPASPAFLVTLAAVGALVAGAAGTVAYLGVSEYLENRPAASDPQAGQSGTATTTPPEEPCPEFTVDVVRAHGRPGELVSLIHVEGTKADGARGEAWICRDSDGTLYYQGHDIDGEPWVIGENALVVGEGINGTVTQEGSTFVATVSYGSYRVSPEEFRLVGTNGTVTVWVMS